MIPDGQCTAVVDRIEDGHATILLEEDGEDAHELVVYPEAIPSEGRHSNAILTVEITDGELAEAKYRPDETEARQESSQSRFDRLSERPPSDNEE
jgi:hypothetical protein